MTQDLLYTIASIALFGIGLFGLIVVRHIIKKILAINMMSVGVFMLLVASASNIDGVPDPVLHAMVLTGIVVAIAGTALALFLANKIHTLGQVSDRDGQ
ncbi:MAG: multicomponent Na+:H+ antiporter subunit C [Candidatus Azotimanducaceae bacterium]|jgi:multicomponent Na+:H+ antiporter subunit C